MKRRACVNWNPARHSRTAGTAVRLNMKIAIAGRLFFGEHMIGHKAIFNHPARLNETGSTSNMAAAEKQK